MHEKKRIKRKEGNFRWLPPQSPAPSDEQILEELSVQIAVLKVKHNVSVLKLVALLDLVKLHLGSHLLNEGLDSEE
mgnify:CR=1 FL=1|tara:strand:- start:107 stop:334 length:228 start_codon:yes stop_codon:yes gene_type:complete